MVDSSLNSKSLYQSFSKQGPFKEKENINVHHLSNASFGQQPNQEKELNGSFSILQNHRDILENHFKLMIKKTISRTPVNLISPKTNTTGPISIVETVTPN